MTVKTVMFISPSGNIETVEVPTRPTVGDRVIVDHFDGAYVAEVCGGYGDKNTLNLKRLGDVASVTDVQPIVTDRGRAAFDRQIERVQATPLFVADLECHIAQRGDDFLAQIKAEKRYKTIARRDWMPRVRTDGRDDFDIKEALTLLDKEDNEAECMIALRDMARAHVMDEVANITRNAHVRARVDEMLMGLPVELKTKFEEMNHAD